MVLELKTVKFYSFLWWVITVKQHKLILIIFTSFGYKYQYKWGGMRDVMYTVVAHLLPSSLLSCLFFFFILELKFLSL